MQEGYRAGLGSKDTDCTVHEEAGGSAAPLRHSFLSPNKKESKKSAQESSSAKTKPSVPKGWKD